MKTHVYRFAVSLVIILTGSSLMLNAQSECEPGVSRVQSITNYSWNLETNKWDPVTERLYNYDGTSFPVTLTTIDYNSRENISRITYNRDRNIKLLTEVNTEKFPHKFARSIRKPDICRLGKYYRNSFICRYFR